MEAFGRSAGERAGGAEMSVAGRIPIRAAEEA
jgi:hypothetical protein